MAGFGDEDGVLVVRREGAVEGHDGPTVVQYTDIASSGVDHRLDGDGHAGDEPGIGARGDIIRNLRILVHLESDSVTAVLAYDPVSESRGVAEHGPRYIVDARARDHGRDRLVQTFPRHAHELFCLGCRFAGFPGDRRVGKTAVQVDAAVYPDDISLDEAAFVGNSMNDHLVHREAERSGIVLIIQEGRAAFVSQDEVVSELVEFEEAHPGLHHGAKVFEQFREEGAGSAYSLYLFPILKLYHDRVSARLAPALLFLDFGFDILADAVEDAVDEFVGFFGAVFLGDLDGLVNGYAGRDIGLEEKTAGSHP